MNRFLCADVKSRTKTAKPGRRNHQTKTALSLRDPRFSPASSPASREGTWCAGVHLQSGDSSDCYISPLFALATSLDLSGTFGASACRGILGASTYLTTQMLTSDMTDRYQNSQADRCGGAIRRCKVDVFQTENVTIFVSFPGPPLKASF